jgi:hypothetical protein
VSATQSTTAKAPRQPNKLAGEGCHAFIQNGAIHLLQFGKVEPVSRWDAVCALAVLDGSPFPTSQERARQIRAALNQSQKETYNGHAH